MKITSVTCHVLAGPDLDVSAALPIPIARRRVAHDQVRAADRLAAAAVT